MPDDTFEIPEVPSAEVDYLAPTESRFYECAECALQPGSPTLCADCLDRRREFNETGRTRRPVYHRLQSDIQRALYVQYLWRNRDNEVPFRSVSEADLAREFPDRHEPRLNPNRWGAAARRAQIEPLLPMEGAVVVRNSWGIPSLSTPMQVSNLFNTQQDLEYHQRQIEVGAGLQPGHLMTIAGRGSGRSWFAAQMALEAAQRGMNVSVIRPQGAPLNVSATVSAAYAENRPVSVEEIMTRLRELGGVPPEPEPGLFPPDPEPLMAYTMGVDRSVVRDQSVFTTMELSPEYVQRLVGEREAPTAWVSDDLALAAATILADEFLYVDVENDARTFSAWPVYAIQQLFNRVGVSLTTIGLTNEPAQVAERATWDAVVTRFIESLQPRPNRPGEATGPSRFDREFDVPEQPVYRRVEPPPRLVPPSVQPATLAYLNDRRSSDGLRAAYEKLFGKEGEFILPSRFERINWNGE